jgi:hypothetical protein
MIPDELLRHMGDEHGSHHPHELAWVDDCHAGWTDRELLER